MTTTQFHSKLLMLLPTILLILAAATRLFGLAAAAQAEEQFPIARPHCRDKCGNISIPFPFGIGPGCFLARPFEVVCNDSASPPRAFLVFADPISDWGETAYQQMAEATISGDVTFPVFNESAITPSPIELMDISVAKHEVRAYAAVSSYCTKSYAEQVLKIQFTSVAPGGLSEWPLSLSMKRNTLVGVGKLVEARLATDLYMDVPVSEIWSSASCDSYLLDDQQAVNGSCAGHGCCQVPSGAGEIRGNGLPRFALSFQPSNDTLGWKDWEQAPCSYAMLVETSWYNFSTPDLYGYQTLSKKLQRGVPIVIDFVIVNGNFSWNNGSCPAAGQPPPPGYVCASSNSFCTTLTFYSYVCECSNYYEGNPYIANGCQDIDECKNPDLYPCHGDCKNRLGCYDCPCKRGMRGDGIAGTCKDIFPLVARVVVGTS